MDGTRGKLTGREMQIIKSTKRDIADQSQLELRTERSACVYESRDPGVASCSCFISWGVSRYSLPKATIALDFKTMPAVIHP